MSFPRTSKQQRSSKVAARQVARIEVENGLELGDGSRIALAKKEGALIGTDNLTKPSWYR